MKKLSLLGLISAWFSMLVNLLYRISALIKETYNPKRDYRLKGFKLNVVSCVRGLALGAKAWTYEMFSRWHIDGYSLA